MMDFYLKGAVESTCNVLIVLAQFLDLTFFLRFSIIANKTWVVWYFLALVPFRVKTIEVKVQRVFISDVTIKADFYFRSVYWILYVMIAWKIISVYTLVWQGFYKHSLLNFDAAAVNVVVDILTRRNYKWK